jgi:hypothetical protein
MGAATAGRQQEDHRRMATAGATYQFSLVKGDERFLVRCDAGSEEAVIGQLMEWADDPELNFDWFDAAVLSRQVTQRVFGRTQGEDEPQECDHDS